MSQCHNATKRCYGIFYALCAIVPLTKSDLDSTKVVNELMALCHEKSQILIITNKDFFCYA